MRWKDYKKCEKLHMCKTCKKSHFCGEYNKIYKECKCCLKYMWCDVLWIHWFMEKIKTKVITFKKKKIFSKIDNKYTLWNKFNRKTVEEYLELNNMQNGELINMF